MINGKTISVIITTYTRFATILQVIDAWLTQPIDELWVLNGNGRLPLRYEGYDKRLAVFNMPFDLGTKMDYAFALLTQGDYIILADDDVVPNTCFTSDLFDGYHNALDAGIVGIIGRSFHGPKYHGDTIYYRSDTLKDRVSVGFVGVVCFAPRTMFGFDVRGMPRNCDDLWWQMKVCPSTPKYVIPTKAYADLPCCKDKTAMYHNMDLVNEREEFYRYYYERNWK